MRIVNSNGEVCEWWSAVFLPALLDVVVEQMVVMATNMGVPRDSGSGRK